MEHEKKRPQQQDVLSDDDLSYATEGVDSHHLKVRASSCCKYYEPFLSGADNSTCFACKYSSGVGEYLCCEHSANML